MGLKDKFGVDLGVFKDSTTWKALAIGIVLFSIIGYAGLSMFDLASEGYGVDRDDIRLAPDFEVETVNRTVEEGQYVNDTGWFRLSDHRGKVVIVDFMAIDCGNCHLVQAHLEKELDTYMSYDGDYEIVIISVGSWYDLETLSQLNNTFGDPDSSSHMPWIVATGAADSVIKSDVIHSGTNSSSIDLDDGAYCIKAQVNKSQEEIKCFDIGQENNDNDNSEFDVEGTAIHVCPQPFRFYLLERVQSAIQALKGSDQADALALLDTCNMTAVLDLKLDRGIGRANNLEVWLD